MHRNQAGLAHKFTLTRAMVQHIMPEFGSIDITMKNLDSKCGLESDTVKVLTICDLGRSVSPEITFATKHAPAGGAITLKWAPLPAVRNGELFKVNWYTSSSFKTHDKDSFEHRGKITRQAYHKGTTNHEEDIPVADILTDMKTAKYFIMKLLNVNRCYRKGHFSNFVIYKKDGAGGLERVLYNFNDPEELNHKG